MRIASTTDVQNSFGQYLQYAQEEGEVLIMKNGKPAAKLVSIEKSQTYLTDSLRGILKDEIDYEKMREERARKRANLD